MVATESWFIIVHVVNFDMPFNGEIKVDISGGLFFPSR
jgi:hypothetical protein